MDPDAPNHVGGFNRDNVSGRQKQFECATHQPGNGTTIAPFVDAPSNHGQGTLITFSSCVANINPGADMPLIVIILMIVVYAFLSRL
jgi:hypothetical protein